MGLQKQIYNTVAPAIEGMVEAGNDAHYSAVAYKTGADVAVGHFLFPSADDATVVTNASTTAKPIGILPLLRAFTTPTLAATLTVQKGEFVAPLVRGHICVKSATATAVGQNVFASQTDGSVGTAAAATLTGYTATNFVVEKLIGDGTAGSLIIITNQVAA